MCAPDDNASLCFSAISGSGPSSPAGFFFLIESQVQVERIFSPLNIYQKPLMARSQFGKVHISRFTPSSAPF